MATPDTSWLPKGVRSSLSAVITAVTLLALGWVGYAQAQSWVNGTARKTAQEEVAELKPWVKEIREDSKFNRCAMIAHINNKPSDLYNCYQPMSSTPPGK